MVIGSDDSDEAACFCYPLWLTSGEAARNNKCQSFLRFLVWYCVVSKYCLYFEAAFFPLFLEAFAGVAVASAPSLFFFSFFFLSALDAWDGGVALPFLLDADADFLLPSAFLSNALGSKPRLLMAFLLPFSMYSLSSASSKSPKSSPPACSSASSSTIGVLSINSSSSSPLMLDVADLVEDGDLLRLAPLLLLLSTSTALAGVGPTFWNLATKKPSTL